MPDRTPRRGTPINSGDFSIIGSPASFYNGERESSESSPNPEAPGFAIDSSMRHSQEATLEIYGSVFGIAPILLTLVDRPVQGTGTVSNSFSGKFTGFLSFDTIEKLSLTRYKLKCEVTPAHHLTMEFLDTSNVLCLIFECDNFLSKPGKFSGIFQFN